MLCSNCKEKEITSQITGDLCTSCYFSSKSKPSLPEIENQRDGTSIHEPNWIHEPTESELEAQKELVNLIQEKPPTISKDRQEGEKDVKYCQSCLERGFGLVPATREWREDYFICDDCFEPLINQMLHPTDEVLRIIRENPSIDSDKPILNQFYETFNYPEHLRYQTPDKALNSRNEYFNYHAPALVNQDVKEIASKLEQMQTILFAIKYETEFYQDYINRIKHTEREKNQLNGLEKSKKEFSKSNPSKVKLGQDQKMADTLFKAVEPDSEKRLKMYLDLQKQAREQEFKNRTGT